MTGDRIELVTPVGFLEVLLADVQAAEAMLAHELGHVVQQDTRLWLYASAFVDEMLRLFLPFYIVGLIFTVLLLMSTASPAVATSPVIFIVLLFYMIFISIAPIWSLYSFYGRIKTYRRCSEELADLAAWLFIYPNVAGLNAALERLKGLRRRRFFNIHPTPEQRLKKVQHFGDVVAGRVRRLKLSSYSLVGEALLLSSVAVPFLLAAILLPVFSQARDKARQTSCLSNEKQLGLALMMYTQDYDEQMPPPVPGTNMASANSLPWTNALYPYLRGSLIYVCPSAKKSDSGLDGSVVPKTIDRSTGAGVPIKTTYLFNGIVAGRSLAELADGPGGVNGTVVLHERERLGAPTLEPNYISADDRTRAIHFNRGDYDRIHFGGGNLTFVDGHTKWLNKEEIAYTSFLAPAEKNPGLPSKFEDDPSKADQAYQIVRKVVPAR